MDLFSGGRPSEIERNKVVLIVTLDTYNENIKKRKEALAKGKNASEASITYATGRFRHVAVETLVISRYIDAAETFYETAEEYMDELIRVNDRLSAWPSRPESVETWLLERQKETKSFIDEFEVLLIQHKKAIETIL